MADKKVKYGAKNIFGLDPAVFDCLSGSENKTHEYAESTDFQGDLSLACPYNDQIAQQASYRYKKSTASTDFINDVVAIGLRLGRFMSQGVITAIELSFSNTEQPTLNITGHQHSVENGGFEHSVDDLLAEWDLDLENIVATIPDCMGVPTGGAIVNSNPESTITSLTISFSCDHSDENGSDGQHFTGNNGNGRVTISASFLGEPDLTLAAGWNITENPTGPSTGNSAFYTTSLSAYKVLPRYAYLGLWNASTNIPALADGVGTDEEYYKVSQAGDTNFGAGVISSEINDQVEYVDARSVWRNMHKFQGDLNADTNDQGLADGTGVLNTYYEVTVAGTSDFGAGGIVLIIGDMVKYNGTLWVKA